MRRVAELIHRRDAVELKAAVEKDARIAGEGGWIARRSHHLSDLARGELLRLALRTLSRRIEHDAVNVPQFLRHQRTAKQIAGFGFDRLQALGVLHRVL